MNNAYFTVYTHHGIQTLTDKSKEQILFLVNNLLQSEIPMRHFNFEKTMNGTVITDLLEIMEPDVNLITLYDTPNEKMVGICFARFNEIKSETVTHIWFLNILEEYRGKGYGKYFMNKIESYIHEMHGTAVLLSVMKDNNVARSFYNELGYSETQVYMAKEIYKEP